MGFKRALWSSGYTYKMRCPFCGTNNKYTDKALDFRAWYPNGFVLCATCRKPLRHNEIYAVDNDGNPVFNSQAEADASVEKGYLNSLGYPQRAQDAHTAQKTDPAYDVPEAAAAQAESNADAGGDAKDEIRYCNKCGRKYRKGIDVFCSGCGNKLAAD